MGKYRSNKSKKDNKMAILCSFQAKEGPNIGYRKRMNQTVRTIGCLSSRNNTWHTKLGVL